MAEPSFHISTDLDSILSPLLISSASPTNRELNRTQSSISFIEEDIQKYSIPKTVVLLLKSFIGTGVLFIPKSFHDAGLVPAILSMLFTASLSFYGVKILLKLTLVTPGSYWQMAQEIGGRKMKLFVMAMLLSLQSGLVMMYTAFVAYNFTELAKTYTGTLIDPIWFVLSICVLLVPVCFTSKLKNFSTIATLGNIFILITLSAIIYYSAAEISSNPKPLKLYGNYASTLRFMGTSVFAFEGIGLVVPLAQTLENSPSFTHIMYMTTVGILCMYMGLGLITSIGFGDDIKSIIFENLIGERVVASLVFFYNCSVLTTIPLTIFPVFEIVDEYTMGLRVKQKYLLKISILSMLCCLSWVFYSHLDLLVALLGSFCCIPLGIIIPGMLGYKIEKSWTNINVIACGVMLVFLSLVVLIV
eukprot:NODE_26_length_35450_cov_0.398320.p6 type:complete len:416 gc:universal NODE_26_length_35450_cov_0.398320:18075-19322(+)